jgi:hypothetical protein
MCAALPDNRLVHPFSLGLRRFHNGCLLLAVKLHRLVEVLSVFSTNLSSANSLLAHSSESFAADLVTQSFQLLAVLFEQSGRRLADPGILFKSLE